MIGGKATGISVAFSIGASALSVPRLIRHFEGLGRVPVDVADVLAQVRKMLPGEMIEVEGVDLPANQLRGAHYRYFIDPLEGSALGPQSVTKVLYSTRMDQGYQRLVAVKELIHVFDVDPARTRGREEVVRLGQKLCKFDHKISNGGLQAFFDELAKFQALAILFPFGLREEVMDKYSAGAVTAAQLGSQLGIPQYYAEVVMQELWEPLRESLLTP